MVPYTGLPCVLHRSSKSSRLIHTRGKVFKGNVQRNLGTVFLCATNCNEPSPESLKVSVSSFSGHIDLWTREASGCQCNFDSGKLGCACCAKGGCPCGRAAPKRCTQCGLESYCPKRKFLVLGIIYLVYSKTWTGAE